MLGLYDVMRMVMHDLHDSHYSLWKELHHTSLNHLHTTTGNSSPYGMLNRSLSSDHVQDIIIYFMIICIL